MKAKGMGVTEIAKALKIGRASVPKSRSTPIDRKMTFVAQATRRKVSGGTRRDVGCACRDGFIGLAKTCFKLSVGFWDYLGARLNVPGCQLIPPLPELILAKARSP